MKPCNPFDRAAAQAAALALLLAPACGGDDDAGGSSYPASATHTESGTSSTTDVTPTTSATGPTASDTDSTSPGTGTTGTTSTTAPPDPLMVDCGTPPAAAQGAKYDHKPSASGGAPGYDWSATGLPDGLAINKNTGEITGVPTTPGDYTIGLTVQDTQGDMAMTTCPLVTVNDQLTVDYDALEGEGPCIVAGGGKTILDFVKGGDGSPVTCATPGGSGDGKLPAGITVDPATCATAGAIAETRYGGWAWIVTAEQSGVRVHAPYCATQPQQAPKAYAIVGDHSGGTDNELEPMLVKLKAADPVRFDGDADPVFDVNKGSCGDSCFFGFLYRVTPSPFGTGACKDDKDGCFGLCPLIPDANEPDGDKLIQCSLLPKMGTPKLGFTHEMWAKGDVLPAEFTARPFIIQWSLDYCVSSVQADCQGKDAILANGNSSNLEFPVIFRAQ